MHKYLRSRVEWLEAQWSGYGGLQARLGGLQIARQLVTPLPLVMDAKGAALGN